MLYASHTVWDSQGDFIVWTKSEQFRDAHKSAGDQKPKTLGHPEFEGFEVMQLRSSGRAKSRFSWRLFALARLPVNIEIDAGLHTFPNPLRRENFPVRACARGAFSVYFAQDRKDFLTGEAAKKLGHGWEHNSAHGKDHRARPLADMQSSRNTHKAIAAGKEFLAIWLRCSPAKSISSHVACQTNHFCHRSVYKCSTLSSFVRGS